MNNFILDTHALQAGARLEADYCIIGSGMGGASVAKTLCEAGADVLLIEAGSSESDSGSEPTVGAEVTGRPFRIPLTRCIELGGTSNAWHGLCTELTPEDYDVRSWIPDSGWPIGPSDLKPFYKEARELVFGKSAPDMPVVRSRVEDIAYDHQILEPHYFECTRPPFKWKPVLLSLIQSGKLRCLMHAPALKLIYNSDQTRVEQVLVGAGAGTVQVKARVFVLCAGALETPRLLLNSINAAELDRRRGVIGQYLMDHPVGHFSKIRFRRPVHAPLHTGWKLGHGHEITVGLKATAAQQRAYAIPNHCMTVRPSFTAARMNDELLYSFLGARGTRDLSFRQVRTILGNADVAYRILITRSHFPSVYLYGDLYFTTEQIPNRQSCVRLAARRDRYGFPVASVHWQLGTEDKAAFERYSRTVLDHGLQSPQYRMARRDSVETWWEHAVSAAHHCGTARMASSPAKGVVDWNLKRFDCGNLYVCDASVLPTVSFANPSLTIMALGLRLARHLLTTERSVLAGRSKAPVRFPRTIGEPAMWN